MSDTALQAIFIALISGSFPVLAIVLTGRQRRNETLETWARSDAQAAAIAAEANAQRKSQILIAEEAHSTSVRLDLVHKLVNNTLTVEKERALLLTRGQLSQSRVNASLLHELGRHKEAEMITNEITELESAIESLEVELADRARQVELAAPEIAETEQHPM